MKQKFTCPNCNTRFKVEPPDGAAFVMCPNCGTNIPVMVDEVGTLGDNLRHAATREGNWIIWAAVAFAGVWGLVVMLMVLSSRKAAAPAVAVAPPVISRPAPAPVPTIFDTPEPTSATPTPPPVTVAPSLPATRPEMPRIIPRRAALTDAEIVAAIHRGVDFLLSNFTDGEINPGITPHVSERHGIDALAVYSLLHCSQSTRDDRISINSPQMKLMIEHLKKMPMLTTQSWGDPITYSRSLRASALSVYNRPEDRTIMASDLAWLLHTEQDGAFSYDDMVLPPPSRAAKTPPKAPPGMHEPVNYQWDNSNSQYGLIGVWNLAEAGLSVPNKFWLDVEKHWMSCQNAQGTWGYKTDGQGFAMTMAGITALSVCRDFMIEAAATQPSAGPRKIIPRSQALVRAIDWLEQGNNAVSVDGEYYGYSLYGLERAALASGMMFAGTHDIYREMASQVVKKQRPDGAWGSDNGRDAVIETAFNLLFLSRGRNPVLVNKLRYDGDWANHQRDAANLARYASASIERPVNWQAVSLNQPWAAWMESPILYIAGDVPPTLGPADYDRLRNYVDNGGLILTHADYGSEAFNDFAKDLARQLFPKYEMGVVADDDDLWSLQFKIPAPHPRLLQVSNGARKLMIHSTEDIAGRWQANNPKRNQSAFELALNLFVYTTGKAELRSKTDSPYILPPEDAPGKYVPVARIEYPGNWDPEPAAWPRFVRYFWWETGWTLQPANVHGADLKLADYPIAVLTGTTADRPTDADAAAMKKFVQEGGVLFIDCCGGSQRFLGALGTVWLTAIAGDAVPHMIPDGNAIFTGKISTLTEGPSVLPKILLRPYAAQISKPTNTRLMEINVGRGRIIYTEIDVTTGLLGTNTWGITGYSPAYAQGVLKNVILNAVLRDDDLNKNNIKH